MSPSLNNLARAVVVLTRRMASDANLNVSPANTLSVSVMTYSEIVLCCCPSIGCLVDWERAREVFYTGLVSSGYSDIFSEPFRPTTTAKVSAG